MKKNKFGSGLTDSDDGWFRVVFWIVGVVGVLWLSFLIWAIYTVVSWLVTK